MSPFSKDGHSSILMKLYQQTVKEPLDRLRQIGNRITPEEKLEISEDLQRALEKTAAQVRRNQAVPGTESIPKANGGISSS